MGTRAPEGGLLVQNVAKNSKTSQTKLSKIWSRLHFTSEIALDDEHISQFFPDRKVLWMTLEQLFEIFIKFNTFDCIRTIFTDVYVFDNSSSVLGEETQKNLTGTLPELGLPRSEIHAEAFQKLHY